MTFLRSQQVIEVEFDPCLWFQRLMILRIDLKQYFESCLRMFFTYSYFVYLFIISLSQNDFLDLNDLAYLSNPV